MTPLFAPVLQDVAARIAGAGPEAPADPVQQAYRLRDAVELVRPDWVVTHHAPEAEATAARSAGDDVELVDVSLAERAPVSGLVDMTRILAKLYPDTVIAASLTGPAALAAALATGDGDGVDLLDCGDVLAELVSAYVGAGARRVIVWETNVPGDTADEAACAHTAIMRRIEMLGVPGVLCGGSAVDSSGYAAHALRIGGRGAVLVPGETFMRESTEGCLPDTGAEDTGVVLSDGPVPADGDLALLRRTGTDGQRS